jgi:RNA polymerase sigma factor (sigma-70 family)
MAARLPPFEQVTLRHGPALLRFCAAVAGPARADDCFQEALLAALRAYPRLRDPEAIRAWLFQIAARKAVDLHRAEVRAPAPAEDLEGLGAACEAPEPDPALWAQVRALPPKQRLAVALRYLGDLSHADVAKAMGISDAAARRNVFEGLARLRKALRG